MQRNMSGSLSGVIDEMLSGSVAGNIQFESSGGSSVVITPTLSEGTKVADYSVDGSEGALYAPTPIEYEAGDNITIEDGVISATDTTYTAGEGISIENGVISAEGGSGVDITEIEFTKSGNIITLSESFRNYEFITLYARNGEYVVNNTILTRYYNNGMRIGLNDDAAYQWWRIEDDTHINLVQSSGNYSVEAIYGLIKK